MIENVLRCDGEVAGVPVVKFSYKDVVDGSKQEAFEHVVHVDVVVVEMT